MSTTHWGTCSARNGGECDCGYPADRVHPDQPYTPSTGDVRATYCAPTSTSKRDAAAEFDRWLASVRRDAQAEQREKDVAILLEHRQGLAHCCDDCSIYSETFEIEAAIRRNENGDKS